MMTPSKIGEDFKKYLAMEYLPVGFYFSDEKPEDAIGFKRKGNGCIVPLILAN